MTRLEQAIENALRNSGILESIVQREVRRALDEELGVFLGEVEEPKIQEMTPEHEPKKRRRRKKSKPGHPTEQSPHEGLTTVVSIHRPEEKA